MYWVKSIINYAFDILFKKEGGTLEQLKNWNNIIKNEMAENKENLEHFDFKIIIKDAKLIIHIPLIFL